VYDQETEKSDKDPIKGYRALIEKNIIKYVGGKGAIGKKLSRAEGRTYRA
jgi:hypothetical protein